MSTPRFRSFSLPLLLLLLLAGPGLLGNSLLSAQDQPPNAEPKPETPENPTTPPTSLGKGAERSVAAALNWIARHQNEDGSWSLDHTSRCKGGNCSGPGNGKSDSAATGMAVLCYLGAGQTDQAKGPYAGTVKKGVQWLIAHQKEDGDLSAGGTQMYSHGVATLALSECFHMTGDEKVKAAAQKGLDFIQSGQNREGGWRYVHGSADSDMSVFGWQVSALKSGQLADLKVAPDVLLKVRKYLDSSAKGENKDRFSYTPGSLPSLPMTTTGLLVSQYLGEAPDSPVMVGGTKYLAANLPSIDRRNCYYWYYGTHVMHQTGGENWDTWNRSMRKVLIDAQDKTGCTAGSWDPQKPSADAWGQIGGRMMVTSLSCLTLEVYYRYLPLHQRRQAKPEGAEKPAEKSSEKKE